MPGPTADVLILDDDAESAAELADFLDQQGCRVLVAYDEDEALIGLVGWAPHAAILVVDAAPNLAEVLRQHSDRPLVIGLLKPASMADHKRLREFDVVYAKAVSPQLLADAIAAFMAGQTRPL